MSSLDMEQALPTFLAEVRSDLIALTGPVHDAETELWLLTPTASRHLRRVSWHG